MVLNNLASNAPTRLRSGVMLVVLLVVLTSLAGPWKVASAPELLNFPSVSTDGDPKTSSVGDGDSSEKYFSSWLPALARPSCFVVLGAPKARCLASPLDFQLIRAPPHDIV